MVPRLVDYCSFFTEQPEICGAQRQAKNGSGGNADETHRAGLGQSKSFSVDHPQFQCIRRQSTLESGFFQQGMQYSGSSS